MHEMEPKSEYTMESEAYRKNAIAVVILVSVLPLLFLSGDLFPDHRLLPHVLNASHIPFFFLFTWVIFNTVGSLRSVGIIGSLVIANLFVLIIGGCIESSQFWLGRQGSLDDLVRNAIGASLAVVLHPRNKLPPRAPRFLVVSGLTVLLIIALNPLYKNTVDWVYSQNRFPVLADFETPFQLERWRGGEVVRLDGSANRVIGFRFDTAAYSTLAFLDFESDWRGYDCLRFRILNPQAESVSLILRINDREHDLNDQHIDDRYRITLIAVPGWNNYGIDLETVRSAPRNRSMNLAEIERVLFYTISLEEPVELYFDDLLLSHHPATCPAERI